MTEDIETSSHAGHSFDGSCLRARTQLWDFEAQLPQQPPASNRNNAPLVWISIAALLVNLMLCISRIQNSLCDPDEFEYIHVAWHLHNGRILYKDVFQTHPPLFHWINAGISRLFWRGPSFSTIYVYRYFNLLYILMILFAVYGLGTRVLQSRVAGLVSAAVLSSLYVFQAKGTEIRPDLIQNTFWLLGVYVLLHDPAILRMRRLIVAGILFGLAVITNGKAMIGPIGVLLCLSLGSVLRLFEFRRALLGATAMVVSAGIVVAVSWFSFVGQHAGHEYLFYAYGHNFTLMTSGTLKQYYFMFFLKYQPLFVLLVIMGLLLICKDIKARPDGELKAITRRRLQFLLALSIITAMASLSGMAMQACLMFLPMLSVIVARVIIRTPEIFASWPWRYRRAPQIVTLLLVFAGLMGYAICTTPLQEHHFLACQKQLTTFVVNNSSRNEPVLFLWNNDGGYMFNEDVQYFWHTPASLGRIHEMIGGPDVLGLKLINVMEEKQVKFIIASDAEICTILPAVTQRYINQYYVKDSTFSSLWHRRHIGHVE